MAATADGKFRSGTLARQALDALLSSFARPLVSVSRIAAATCAIAAQLCHTVFALPCRDFPSSVLTVSTATSRSTGTKKGGRRRCKALPRRSAILALQYKEPREANMFVDLLLLEFNGVVSEVKQILHDETLQAEDLEVREHSDSSGEGAPVVSCAAGKNCGESSANAATKRLNDEHCYAESVVGAKRLQTTGEFHPSSTGIDPMHVLKKLNKMQEISSAMASVLLKIFAHGSDRIMFIEKMLDLDKEEEQSDWYFFSYKKRKYPADGDGFLPF
nr:unnamed protein product [Digitaria exilis]